MDHLHNLLKRQLRRSFGDQFCIPDEWKEFIDAVNNAYRESDMDRGMLERSLELSSQELLQANSETRAIFQAIPDLLFRLDSEGKILNYKAGATTDLMLQPKEFLGKRIQDVPLKQVSEKFTDAITRVQESKIIISIEYSLSIQQQILFFEARLVPLPEDQIVVIIRNITERKRAEEAIQESEERFRMVFENAFDGISIYEENPDPFKRNLVECNEQYAAMAGRNREELLKIGNTKALQMKIDDPEDVEWQDSLVSRKVFRGSFTWVRPDAKENIIEYVGVPILWRGKSYSIGIDRDVTDRKRAEEALFTSQQMLRTVLDTIPQRVFWKDRQSFFVGCNKPCALDCGYSDPSELIGKTDYETASAKTADRYRADDQEVIETGIPKLDYEEPQFKPDGSQGWLKTSKVPLRDKDGKVIGVLGTYEDITERKKAEESLKRERNIFRVLIDNLPDAIYVKDTECRKTIANVADVRNMGRQSESEVLGKTDFELYPADIAAGFYADDLTVIQQGKPVLNKEEFFIDKDGKKDWLMTFKLPMKDEEGRIIGLVGIGREITEQKRAMEALKLLSHTVKSIGESISITDLKNNLLFVNEAFLNTYGYTEQEVIGKHISIVSCDPAVSDQHILAETIKGGWQGELLNRKKDGTVFSVFLSTSVVYDEKDQPVGLVGVGTDITERKLAAEALRESDEKLRNIVEHSTNLFYSRNINQVFTYLSPQARDIFDCEPDEALVCFKEFMTDNSINTLGCEIAEKSVRTGARQEAYELELLSRKGRRVWVEIQEAPVVKDGKTISIVGAATDITERRWAEMALQVSEKKYRDIVTWAPIGIYQSTLSGKLLSCNSSIAEMLGYESANELVGCNMGQDIYYDEKDRERFIAKDNSSEKKMTISHETRWKTKNGSIIWVLMTVHDVRDKSSEILYYEGFVFDVTERKHAEESLRESEERFRLLVENSTDIVTEINAADKYLYVSPNVKSILDFEPMDLVGTDVLSRVYGKDKAAIGEILSKLGGSATYRYRDRTGGWHWFESSGRVYYTSSGEQRMVMVSRDITERRKAEQELEFSRKQLQHFTEHLEHVLEEERKRISRELHDELGQLLTILKFDLSWLKLEGIQSDANIIARINAMMESVNEALASVKRISKEIRPPQLDALGLIGAIQWDIDQVEKKTGLKGIVTVEPGDAEIKGQVSTVLYRVFREALTNILRHAHAEHVFIKLSQRLGSVLLTIRDDGRGISKKELKGTTSLGLVGIRERLRMVDGTFTIEGKTGVGTVLSVEVPLKKKNGERIS